MSLPLAPAQAGAIDPLYVRLGMITRGVHDTLSALRVGLDAETGAMQAALHRTQPDANLTSLLALRLLAQLERTETDLMHLLADSQRKGRMARRGSAAGHCIDELLGSAAP
ncbi:hypothetical protein [Pseudoduganella aquatica]|uniref:Uncharacterized protein n=1 Tax=Pseudoduganella aquatica TaxID=2660641 RepID=A0A7X4KPI6_9BURK|nr:hypothetical protein [Pseudoduganella aquatica]MYN11424.1 hypothetical protein [Pseudoduganella aquatica]